MIDFMNKKQMPPELQPDTDHLSIYDLPALNSVISQYEEPYMKNDKELDTDSKSIPTGVQ